MSDRSGPLDQTRRVKCVECLASFDAPRASVGEAVRCPHCGIEIHVGPPRRSKRPVRRSHVVEEALTDDRPDLGSPERVEAPPPALRVLTQDAPAPPPRAEVRCVNCDKQFTAPHGSQGTSADCPHCGVEVVIGEPVREKHRVRRRSSNPALTGSVAAYTGIEEAPAAAHCTGCGEIFVVSGLRPGALVTCEHCGEQLVAGPRVHTTTLAGPGAGRAAKGRRLFNVFFVLIVLALVAAAVGIGAYYEYIDWFSRPESVPR